MKRAKKSARELQNALAAALGLTDLVEGEVDLEAVWEETARQQFETGGEDE